MSLADCRPLLQGSSYELIPEVPEKAKIVIGK